MPTILLLNHYLPPDPAPTGRLLGELGDHLEAHGWTVVRIAGVDPLACYRTRSGHGKIRKLLGWIAAHGRILLAGLRAPRADLVLCLTDPPCLILTAAVVARFHRARLAHWVMDLYPDLARELGEFPRAACALLTPAMRLAYRFTDLSIALDSAMSDRLRTLGSRNLATIAPWVLSTTRLEAPDPADIADKASCAKPAGNQAAQFHSGAPPFTWLYSGNLGRAHLYEPLLRIQHELESRNVAARLVFQGSGAAVAAAKQRTAELELKHCEFRGYAPDEQLLASLLAADLLVATLAESLDGMLWPSKVALLKHLDRPLLWVGPRGDIAQMLADRSPTSLAISPLEWKQAVTWLESLARKKGALSAPGIRLPSIKSERETSLFTLQSLLRDLLRPSSRHLPPSSG